MAFIAAAGTFGALALASSDADARPYHHHGRARVGVYIGAPLVVAPWPYYRPYYYDPYYYPRPVVIQEQPVIYTEQAQAPVQVEPAPQAQAPQQQYWYYCQDTQTYYPYVQNCATPWQRVIPQPPR